MDTQDWAGGSGASYPYTVLQIGLLPNIAYGNYIFARKDVAGAWVAVFVGHGELSSRADLNSHRLRNLILGRGATHVHIHENPSLKDRMIERADILFGHPEAYSPSGGNTALSA